jgi:NifU-like protein
LQGDKVKPVTHEVPSKVAKMTNIQKIQLIQQTINEQIRPALRAHGGNIELIDVEGNKVVVAFRDMCAQCRMAEFTMKEVVEAKLREFVSEELYVEEDKETEGQPHTHRE